MSQLTPGAVRAAAFIAETQRLDFVRQGFAPSGKTTGQVKCNPPNKPCKGRCIPPNWKCRATGGGTDSHSRAMEFDLVGGVNTAVRGFKSTLQGLQSRNPEVLTRGIKGIQRGIIKATPGNNKDEKAEFASRVRAIGNTVFVGLVGGWIAQNAHIYGKKWNSAYAQGWGKDIDNAAKRATDTVLDNWDATADRFGFTGLNTGRARIAKAGTAAASQIGRQGRIAARYENILNQDPRNTNYLFARGRLRGGAAGMSAVNDIDIKARAEGWDRTRWEAEKVKALYSMRTPDNVSVFAGPAANEYLAAQWGFQLPPRSIRERSDISEMLFTKNKLRNSIDKLHTDLHADLKRRGIPATEEGYKMYADQMLSESPSMFGSQVTDRQRAEYQEEYKYRITEVMMATTSAERRSLSANIYTRTRNTFDSYFTDAAAALSVDPVTGRPDRAPHSVDSPFGDAAFGLSRVHSEHARSRIPRSSTRGGRPIKPINRDTASFLNGWYYHKVVKQNKAPYLMKDSNRAIRLASQLSGTRFTTREEALQWFNQHNFNVHIPEPRRTGRNRDDSAPENGLPPRLRAYLEVRQDLQRPEGFGKKCGKSFIPRDKKCNNGLETAAKVALGTAVVGGVAYGLHKARLHEFHTGLGKGRPNFGGGPRMRRTSYAKKHQPGMNSEQFASMFNGLEKVPGATPKNVEAMQNFIKKRKLYSNVSTFYEDLSAGVDKHARTIGADKDQLVEAVRVADEFGLMDGMASQYSENIFIRSSSKTIGKVKVEPSKVQSAVTNFMDARQTHKDIPEDFETHIKLWTIAGYDADGDTKELLNGIHEIAHKVHFQASMNKGVDRDYMQYQMYNPSDSVDFLKRAGLVDSTPNASPAVYLQQQQAARQQIRDALYAASSQYGRSDLDGRRAETFSELSVLYVTQGKLFKQRHPLAYAWVEDIWNQADA